VPLGTQLTLAAEAEPVVTIAPQFRPVTMAPDRPTSAPLIANVQRALSLYDVQGLFFNAIAHAL
jgi:hypothetical protein